VHLPTFVARMLAFKLSVDTSKLPAVGDLLRSMARCGCGLTRHTSEAIPLIRAGPSTDLYHTVECGQEHALQILPLWMLTIVQQWYATVVAGSCLSQSMDLAGSCSDHTLPI